jgi:hypothetical protein
MEVFSEVLFFDLDIAKVVSPKTEIAVISMNSP